MAHQTPYRYYGTAASHAVRLLRNLTSSRLRFIKHADFVNLSFVDGCLENYDRKRGYRRKSRGHVTAARLESQRIRYETRVRHS
jgi:hypothetical protein